MSVDGEDVEACGTILLPCLSVKYAVESGKVANEIRIHGKGAKIPNAIFHESQIQVNRSVKFQGTYGIPTIISKEQTLFTVLSNDTYRTDVTFTNINFERIDKKDGVDDMALIFVMNSSLNMTHCSFLSVPRPLRLLCDEACDFRIKKITFLSPIIAIHVDGSGRISMGVVGTTFIGDQQKSEIGFKYRTIYSNRLAQSFIIMMVNCQFSRFKTAVLLHTSALFTYINIISSTFQENNNLEECNPGTASSSVSVVNLWPYSIEPKRITRLLFTAYACIFRNNYGTEGSGISIRSRYSKFYGIITKSVFENNRAWYTGGAVSLYNDNKYSSKLLITSSYFANNTVLNSQHSCPFIDGKTSGSGGAISCGRMTTKKEEVLLTVRNSTFLSNSAVVVGGSIYAVDCVATLRDSSINTRTQNPLAMTEAIAISITNAGFLYGVKINVNDRSLQRSIIRIDGRALIDLHSSLSCPIGTIADITSVGGGGIYKFISLYCSLCGRNEYNLGGGSLRKLHVSNSVCKECPPGAECQNGIVKPKDNYWGFIDKTTGNLSFVQLPVGYGCTKQQCTRYNSCAVYRNGTLCSACIKGYTESILSSRCIRNDSCNKRAFWTMVIILIASYLAFFIWKQNLTNFLTGQLLWYRRRKYHGGSCQHNSPNLNDQHLPVTCEAVECKTDHSASFVAGIVKIIFYFYQIEALLDVYGREKELLASVKSSVRNIFNFNLVLRLQSSVCIMSDITPIGNVIARSIFVGSVTATLILLYIAGKVFCSKNKGCCFIKRSSPDSTKSCFSEKVLAALFEVWLLSYSTVTHNVISLLDCRKIGNQRVLYLQGDIECYQTWQYGLVAAGLAWIVPFWMYVCILPKAIRDKRLQARGIFLGCVFPIPLIIYCLITMRLPKNPVRPWQVGINSHDTTSENSDWQEAGGAHMSDVSHTDNVVSSVRQILCAPFNDAVNSSSYISWDGVYIFRRLFIVSVFVLVHNPIYKLYIILAGQIFFLTHHVYTKPYKEKALNIMETGSLAFLIMTNAINLLAVYDFTNGITEVGEQLLLSKIFVWIETIIYLLVPTLVATSVSILAITRFVYLIFKATRKALRNKIQIYSSRVSISN